MGSALLERHLLRARDLADTRYGEPLDLATLAREANVSPRHFSRSFRRVFGETPYQYLLSRRLERARHLLRTTDTTTFKRQVGVSPTTFREAYGGPSEADRVPLCFVKAWARHGAFREDSRPRPD
jgi:AraC-like DNA-binding protein